MIAWVLAGIGYLSVRHYFWPRIDTWRPQIVEQAGAKQGAPKNLVRALADEYRERLIDAVVGTDEGLMEKYYGGQEITREDLNTAIRQQPVPGRGVSRAGSLEPVGNMRNFVPQALVPVQVNRRDGRDTRTGPGRASGC